MNRIILTKEEQVALRVFRKNHHSHAAEVFTINHQDKRIVPAVLSNMGFKKFFTALYVGYDVKIELDFKKSNSYKEVN